MRKFILILFISTICLCPVLAGQLRVEQTGFIWLTPDKFYDVMDLNSRITKIKSNIAQIKLDTGLTIQEYGTSSRYIYLYPNVVLLNRFDGFNAGLILRSANYFHSSTYSLTNSNSSTSMSLLFGINFAGPWSAGMGLHTYLRFLTPDISRVQAATLSADFEENGLCLGTSLYAGTIFTMKNYLLLNFNVYFGLAEPDGAALRAYIKTNLNYDANGKQLNAAPDTYEGLFFGRKSYSSSQGFSYSSAYGTVKYSLSLVNDWNIYSLNRSQYGESVSEETEKGDTVYFKAGLEIPLFADFFLFRISLFPLIYSWRERIVRNTNPLPSESYFYNDHSGSFKFLSADSIITGISFKTGPDASLDLRISQDGIVSFNTSTSDRWRTYSSDERYWDDRYTLAVSAEYIAAY